MLKDHVTLFGGDLRVKSQFLQEAQIYGESGFAFKQLDLGGGRASAHALEELHIGLSARAWLAPKWSIVPSSFEQFASASVDALNQPLYKLARRRCRSHKSILQFVTDGSPPRASRTSADFVARVLAGGALRRPA